MSNIWGPAIAGIPSIIIAALGLAKAISNDRVRAREKAEEAAAAKRRDEEELSLEERVHLLDDLKDQLRWEVEQRRSLESVVMTLRADMARIHEEKLVLMTQLAEARLRIEILEARIASLTHGTEA